MPKKSFKILVADDEEMLLELLVDFLNIILEKTQYHILTALRVDGAIKMIETNDFDLVITDVNFPDGLGYEILEAAKMKNRKTIVFLMSGMSQNLKKEYASNADGLFEKPVSIIKLDEALRLFGFV